MVYVVLDEHHLCAFLQGEAVVCGIGHLGEVALRLGIVYISFAAELGEFLLIDALGWGVVGGETDIAVSLAGLEAGDVAAIQLGEGLLGGLVAAYLVEQLQEMGVLLAIHLLQLHGEIARSLQRLAGEEVRGVVVLLQQLLFRARGNWSQLVEVAYHEELHATERLCRLAVTAQGIVHGI